MCERVVSSDDRRSDNTGGCGTWPKWISAFHRQGSMLARSAGEEGHVWSGPVLLPFEGDRSQLDLREFYARSRMVGGF